jgi:predicted MPP superfamily phosphohydrolase
VPFLLIDDIRRGIVWMFQNKTSELLETGNDGSFGSISRSVFLRNLALVIGGVPVTALFAGIFYGAYRYKIHRVSLTFKHLPKEFDGLKIVQLSDIHSGSFTKKHAVEKGIRMVNELKPDVILFTGDLVNNKTDEVEPWISVLSKLSAPMGVFSILGNHDYGDYYNFPSETDKRKNLMEMHQSHKKLGWRLLLNESTSLEKNGARISLIGVENWGMKGFAKYGKLDKAYASATEDFKILMSHDPTHWDAQVKTEFKDIALTLSGHTHGMQFGIEIPGFIKWSPSSLAYKHWAGLYQEANQYLYVNRGFGFLGYPGRVGIWPEITELTLRRS